MESRKKNIMNRSYLVAFGLMLFSFLLIAKLFHIQFSEGDKYREIASKRTLKEDILQPSRGNIFADDGSILATSMARYEVRWDAAVPSKALYHKHKRALVEGLSEILKTSKKSISKKLDKAVKDQSRYLLIGRDLSYSEQIKIKQLPLFEAPSYRGGLIIEHKMVREHPLGKMAERTVGRIVAEENGVAKRVGLEGAFSQYLEGETGQRLKQKIAGGQWKPINDVNEKEPTEGYNVHTTMNVNIQDIAHSALLEQMEKFKADHGTVVVMETQTGKIKAIANLGKTKLDTYFEKLNYAVGESHEPGSTFKLMAMVAALEDKVIDENTPISTGNGELTFFRKYKVRDSKRGGYGTISAAKVFEVSSNTGMVKIIHDNYAKNPKKFVNRLYNMGINKPLGLPIWGEGKPKIPHPNDKKEWDQLDLPWMAYGYGVSLTPLQTLTFYNAIANNGVMVKPRFIEKIESFGQIPEQTFGEIVLNPSICSQSTIDKVKKMMFNVVDKKWGTAHNIKDKDLSIAGKTGTCQVDYNKTDKEVEYVATFVGYFPAEEPKYSCIVVIHKPDKRLGYYGSTVAAPVFKKIAKKIHNALPKTIQIKAEQIHQLSSKTTDVNTPEGVIPNLKGLTPMEALSVLEPMGLTVIIKGKGKVKKQSLKAGVRFKINQKIILELS
ncbi:penicillin-binding transpeptidase domain-containing protein [Flavobacteriaceae bacterium]|nr:penicillin-binding transpeptidase domain-containing protein [Flavobacteriaceae bacterium]